MTGNYSPWNVTTLPPGPDNEADQSMMMATQMTAPGAPPDMKKAYKEEWEALEVGRPRDIFSF